MDKKQQFLDAEKKAQELTETLTALLIEVESYKGAKENLESVRTEIIHLIEALRKSAVNTQDLIQRLKDLDQAELIARISGIELKAADHNRKQLHLMEKNQENNDEKLNTVAKNINHILKQNRLKINEELNAVNNNINNITARLNKIEEILNVIKNQGAEMGKMKKLMMIVLILTLLGIVIGVVNLLM